MMGTGSVRPMRLGGEAKRETHRTEVRLLFRYKRKLGTGQPA